LTTNITITSPSKNKAKRLLNDTKNVLNNQNKKYLKDKNKIDDETYRYILILRF